MSKKDEAIRAAVVALEKWYGNSGVKPGYEYVDTALSLLRSAMEEGEEPVAEMVDVCDGLGTTILQFIGERPPAGTKLYASPIAADTKDKQ